MSLATGVADLLEALVLVPSANESLGGVGERAVGERVARELAARGAAVRTVPVDGVDAPDVVGVFDGGRPGPTVLLCAHLDTVPDVGQPIERHADRITGRGSCDTKASLAAMLTACTVLHERGHAGRVLLAATVDEEAAMRGSRALAVRIRPTGTANAAALAAELGPVDAVVIGEPTSLVPVRAHHGCVRFRVLARGPAGHAAQPPAGRQAVPSAARLITLVEDELLPVLRRRTHPLTGSATLTASMVHAGDAPNVVPAECVVHFDRRLLPGEHATAALDEFDRLLATLRAEGHDLEREAPFVDLPAVETPEGAAVVQAAVAAAAAVTGRPGPPGGVAFSTDACHLVPGTGAPVVVIGPGSIADAHGPSEWVDLDEVRHAVEVYLALLERLLHPS